MPTNDPPLSAPPVTWTWFDPMVTTSPTLIASAAKMAPTRVELLLISSTAAVTAPIRTTAPAPVRAMRTRRRPRLRLCPTLSVTSEPKPLSSLPGSVDFGMSGTYTAGG
ncbi:unannotated protein [freshwater metagenome]|uniref:Unannotated protein n=1 Tax=freshwater metagenome TaxID=449393 RepID=A0A6J7C2T8_9ZZZZ